MTKKSKEKEHISKSVYMPMWVYKQIMEIAEKEQRNFSFIVRRMLETHPDIKRKR